MNSTEEKPVHFQELQREFPHRSDSEIGDAIESLKKEIGRSQSRAEVLAVLRSALA